jgi:hypothetical protein
VRNSTLARSFIGEPKGGRPVMKFKHPSPLSTKEHWGEPKQKRKKDLMAGRPHHGQPVGHSLKIPPNFVSHFVVSPRCPSKRE